MALRNEGDDEFKKIYDEWVEQVIAKKTSLPKFLPAVETLQIKKPILINEQLDELTSFLEEFRLAAK